MTHFRFTQLALPPQVTPQPPQFPFVEKSASQPSAGFPLQSAKPALQPPEQTPFEQTGVRWLLEHLTHACPQALGSLFETQFPPQSWEPPGHTPLQDCPVAMQAPSQRLVDAGHEAPQVTPSQVAVPPVGARHGSHEVPQLRGSLSLKQASPHR